ncbi:MAG TPA: nucleotide-binding domain containing protein, partial [Opitutaceae bacterium]
DIRSPAPWTPESIRRSFAALAAALRERGAWKHLVIEGGATAGAVLHALGWRELTVAHEWAPGVASLCPAPPRECFLTIKPGSYAWPDDLWRQLAISRPRTAAL